MAISYHPERTTFGLLPEPEGRAGSFFTAAVINGLIFVLLLFVGATAKKVIDQHRYEYTELIVPPPPPPPAPPKIRVKVAPAPVLPEPVKQPVVHFEPPKIKLPKPEPKPDLKPVTMEAKVALPVVKAAKPAVILQPQPKAALTAAMPAQSTQVKPSTAPVHLGQTFGVTPNPNATRPATVAAIGNEYGGMQGPATAPHGVVGSTGIGNGLKSGSNAGTVGKVASAGIPGATGTSSSGSTYGNAKVASAGIPAVTTAAVARPTLQVAPSSSTLDLLSIPAGQYTSEAKQLRVQGDVVLRVTFMASGEVLVQGVVHGLGHGLDEEARRVATLIKFRPATRNGQAVDLTTNIKIKFQLA
jgi:TonB family protein